MRTLIKNGMVCDGTGASVYPADVLIEGCVVREIIPDMSVQADMEMDAAGCVVTPAFIDTHRHCDIEAITNHDFGNIETRQGIATVVGGNCGLAPLPVGKNGAEIAEYIEPCLGKLPKTMQLNHFTEYLDLLDMVRKPLNIGSYVGLGTLKAAVKGYGPSVLTAEDMKLMYTYVQESLNAGALGLTAGIMYQPECYSSEEEYVQLIGMARDTGKPLACHIRGEGDNLVSSVGEILRIAKHAGVPLNISHFKATGMKNWGSRIYEAIELIDSARAGGQNVTVDFYPYDGGATTLLSLLPPTLMADTITDTLSRILSPVGRRYAVQEIYREHAGWDNMVTSIGWERIIISGVRKKHNKRFANMDFESAAKLAGFSEPVDFLCELLCDENGKVGIILRSMSAEDIDAVAKLPYSMLISDALYGGSDCPHPRLYGSFPKFLKDYVYTRKVLTLEQAIHKMTQMPAQMLNLTGRGVMQVGNVADVCVFRPDALASPANYAVPTQLCSGFDAVFVNGVPVVHKDVFEPVSAGVTLRA